MKWLFIMRKKEVSPRRGKNKMKTREESGRRRRNITWSCGLTNVSSLTWESGILQSLHRVRCIWHNSSHFNNKAKCAHIPRNIGANSHIISSFTYANFLEDHNSQIWYTIFLVMCLWQTHDSTFVCMCVRVCVGLCWRACAWLKQ